MSSKKRSLGRGLDALLSSNSQAVGTQESLRSINVELIIRGKYQPRTIIRKESIEELANSIRVHGVLQPVVLRSFQGGEQYELIAGERRWRACQLLGLATIPAIVKNVADQDAMSIALIENIQREQLNPVEEAVALGRLVTEFGMTHEKVAEAVGKSRAAVSNLIRLLDLEKESRALLESGHLEMGHARALLGLKGGQQKKLAGEVATKKLSVRATEALVKAARLDTAQITNERQPIDPNIKSLEDNLSERMGAAVVIKHRAGGGGKVEIGYNSLDELDGILAHIQ
jgi:ParB family transcriptional regulator, chromosome partitioning protein